MKIVKQIQLKNVIFTVVENRCILHGRVFVMVKRKKKKEKKEKKESHGEINIISIRFLFKS